MTALLVFLFVYLIPNAWSSWRVAHSGMPLRRKTLAIIGVWLIPLIGNWMAYEELKTDRLSRLPRTYIPLPQARREAPPTQVVVAGQPPFDVREHLTVGHWVPILDFAALEAWASRAGTPEAVATAREAAVRTWLLHLGHWQGEHVILVDSHHCRVLGGFSTGAARTTCRFMADTRGRITQLLDGLAAFPGQTPTLIALDDDDDYCKYVAHFYPEEAGLEASIGMLIRAGYPHFVAVRSDESELEQVLAHEMTHLALSHLALPLWLDEGLAVHTQQRLASGPRNAGAATLLPQHQTHWNAGTLQEFWNGTSFQQGDVRGVLSYELSRALVEYLGRDWSALVRFAKQARREDGGAAAARNELGKDLGELAAAALEAKPESSWAPKPESWARVARKA